MRVKIFKHVSTPIKRNSIILNESKCGKARMHILHYAICISHNIYLVILKADEVENQPKKIEYDRAMQIVVDPDNSLITAHIQFALIQVRAQAQIVNAESTSQFLLHHVKLLMERAPLIGWLGLTIYFLCK